MSVQLLALDTSTSACTVALCVGEITYSRHELLPRLHNQYILPMIQDLMEEANITLSQLEGVVFGAGPGSFTGVRIAASIAQGLAYGLNIPVTPVSTLQVLAQVAYRKLDITRALVGWDARMGEVYWGQYVFCDAQKIMLPVMQDGLYAPDAVPLPASSKCVGKTAPYKPWAAVGSGWKVYNDQLSKRCVLLVDDTAVFPDCYPNAKDLLVLGAYYFKQGLRKDAAFACPVYLRNQVVG